MPNIDRLKRIEAADREFAREQRKADASVAMADYLARQQALHDRTRRLREERLAREAAAPAKPAAASRKKAPATLRKRA